MRFPDGKAFAFTIFDDTDHGTIASTKPVYDLLARCGMRTTKSTWVFPPRGAFTGSSLADEDYRAWLMTLRDSGFEIGLHNVGDGLFTRAEIRDGLETFRDVFGAYPRIHANHAGNPDNLYWWEKRFEAPISLAYRLAYLLRKKRMPPQGGDSPSAPYYWGDLCRDHVTYVRNLTVNHINTLEADARMPYHVAAKPLVKYWFSASDGNDLAQFTELIAPENVDALEASGGACIVYTHFAKGFVRDGEVDRAFRERIEYLAGKRGWFVPTGQLLDHLLSVNGGGDDPGYAYRMRTNIKWCMDRLAKRVRAGK